MNRLLSVGKITVKAINITRGKSGVNKLIVITLLLLLLLMLLAAVVS
jgi:hypothetical protein